jgi:hypothetical protein
MKSTCLEKAAPAGALWRLALLWILRRRYIGLGAGTAVLIVLVTVLTWISHPAQLVAFFRNVGLDEWAYDHLFTTGMKVKMIN